jgi:superfamily I DNA/RNA helicase
LKRNSTSLETVIISATHLLYNRNNTDLYFGKNSHVKVIFVDEAQDISGIQYNFIQILRQHLNCYLILVGDPNQNIYQFQGGSDKYLLDYNVHTYHLRINYRSKQHIIDFFNYLSPHKTDMVSSRGEGEDGGEGECGGEGGGEGGEGEYGDDKVTIFTGTIKSIVEDILKEIRDCPYKREEIAIIGPVKKCIVDNDVYKSLGLSLIINVLHSHKIPFLKHYNDVNDNDKSHSKNVIDHNTKIKEGHINIFKIHGSKGLEFKKVILINFHIMIFEFISDHNIKPFRRISF